MDVFTAIKERRSCRNYSPDPVSEEAIEQILEAGIWAPSGLNNQPWKFGVIRDKGLKTEMAGLTHYSKIVLSADTLIAVFLDSSLGYDRTKDTMAVGACIQNSPKPECFGALSRNKGISVAVSCLVLAYRS